MGESTRLVIKMAACRLVERSVKVRGVQVGRPWQLVKGQPVDISAHRPPTSFEATGRSGPLTTRRYLSLTIRAVALTLPVDLTFFMTPGLCRCPRDRIREGSNTVRVSTGEIVAPSPFSPSSPSSSSYHVGKTMTSLAPAMCAIGSRYLISTS